MGPSRAASHLQWCQAGIRPGPHIFSIFFSIMLHEAKECLPDGIYIHFLTDGSLFNLWRLLTCIKTIGELFAEACTLLTHKEKALQYIINRLCGAAVNFGLTISLKKTEVLYQPPP